MNDPMPTAIHALLHRHHNTPRDTGIALHEALLTTHGVSLVYAKSAFGVVCAIRTLHGSQYGGAGRDAWSALIQAAQAWHHATSKSQQHTLHKDME